ncbi:MAG TPA: hypothetical protein VH437_08960 [Terriglobales bacterium]|jgi:hypothetical protein
MKVLVLAILFSLPVPRLKTPPPQPVTPAAEQHPQAKHGTWYFAETGHAVYCYGPVIRVAQPDGELQSVATVCRGDKVMVPLKD